MNFRYKTLAIYTAKCAIGITLCYVVSLFFQQWIDYTWSLISVVLVLSPEGKDAMDLALTRIKANLVGAATGILVLLMQIPSPWNIVTGAVISLFVCDRLNLNAGARSTLAAVIIILLYPNGPHVWDSALSRVTAVVVGCILGLLITYIFHSIVKTNTTVSSAESGKKEREG